MLDNQLYCKLYLEPDLYSNIESEFKDAFAKERYSKILFTERVKYEDNGIRHVRDFDEEEKAFSRIREQADYIISPIERKARANHVLDIIRGRY